VDLLKLKRKQLSHHSTYRRILADVVDVEELEGLIRDFLSGKNYFGMQGLAAIDGKMLHGTLEDHQNRTYLLAAYFPREGIVRMEVALEGKGGEVPAAPRVLKSLDLRGKVVMGEALYTQREVSTQIVESGGEYIWLAKGNRPQMEENICLKLLILVDRPLFPSTIRTAVRSIYLRLTHFLPARLSPLHELALPGFPPLQVSNPIRSLKIDRGCCENYYPRIHFPCISSRND
jgi:hypothetical protein